MASLNHLEERVREKIATLSDCNQLYNFYMEQNIRPPDEFKEYWLLLALGDDPENIDNIVSLREVLRDQGKPVPDWIEKASAHKFLQDDRARDHQLDAYSYEQKAEFSDMDDSLFVELFEQYRSYSMVSRERFYALYSAVNYITRANIFGAIVECGVWRGGSMMFVSSLLCRLKEQSRDLYLYDTFDGLPRPSEEKDIDLFGNRAIDAWKARSRSAHSSYWAAASLSEVRSNMEMTKYSPDKIHYVEGLVEETLQDCSIDRIALLRLDTDFYASTKVELTCLYPLLKKGGVLIIDDYGHFLGVKEAVDEYFSEIPILLNRIDYSGRIAIKP